MRKIYREINGEIIVGRSLPVLIVHSNGSYVLDDIEIYKDGTIICECMLSPSPFEDSALDGEMLLDDFVQAVVDGKIVTAIPEGIQHIYKYDLAMFTVSEMDCKWEKKEDYILAVRDVLHELNGEPTSSDRCRAVFLHFLEEPSKKNYAQLRQAYAAIPSPWKACVLDDPENGDAPITAILVRDIADIDRDWLEEQRQMYNYLRKKS